jgi:hypothetical protein
VGKVTPANPKRVVHISSIAGQIASLPTPLYMASKHAMNGFIRSLAKLEPVLGIRVNGVAPGVIKTPLWTEHPEKMKMIDESRDVWVSPEEVAEQMLRCCEDDAIPGGTIWEVLKSQYRVVKVFNDPGPKVCQLLVPDSILMSMLDVWTRLPTDIFYQQGAGGAVTSQEVMIAEVMEWLNEPNWGVPK